MEETPLVEPALAASRQDPLALSAAVPGASAAVLPSSKRLFAGRHLAGSAVVPVWVAMVAGSAVALKRRADKNVQAS